MELTSTVRVSHCQVLHEFDLFHGRVFGDTLNLGNVEFVLFVASGALMNDRFVVDFRQFLSDYLDLNYPTLSDKDEVLAERCREAEGTFRCTLEKYQDQDIAYETAMDVLLNGFHFSKYDFIENILLEHFADRFPWQQKKRLIRAYIVALDPLFAQYELCESNEELKHRVCAGLSQILAVKQRK